ncbi:leucyl/phenylalanyl-tRNA--protein transferase [Bacteriovoracaceae bacterium]|nr:leucyl/phenylalanyl-tRNA--protein transferase [Bacteriovoracaceae bacterium]
MGIHSFPPINTADENGLLALGGDLEISSLELAYRNGIFPWPLDDSHLLAWFSPNPRGILFYKDLRISKSLSKLVRKGTYTVKFNTEFEKVINLCASISRKNNPGTWITKKIIKSYIELFHNNHAYSVEVYNSDRLVGGLYGVNFGWSISGESMFYLESNTSKIALIYLMEHLYANGILWLDTQMVTPVVSQLGGKEICREHFIEMLKQSQEKINDPTQLFSNFKSTKIK